ncbi:short-chain dehydrogenase [Haematobacter missouriensis]|uniref:NAD(P)-dependent oxidoreductase n=1 Tax=Haematobacter missouriensis TaxID=366616 RepID=A0A212AV25_9RHOB|nr:SDR family NAD(P)-dependent oxidoreductase [Haematobacter missouriensis]KFI28459.1 short-chain dehydrogenase [Haematobacter missouriensis]OWJ74904.1 NAD(P)-dependent oxidoreductase [Haematobacter missouriensis]OWJ85328.1 NAD(P)-dependent oxidoreductase [Haematobacter missouriensis]
MAEAKGAEFDGKVAIVTGGASGIGAAVVRELAAGGAKVVVADMDEDRAAALATEVGGKPFLVDVTDVDAVRSMVAFAEAEFGALHLAVNNAGISGQHPAPVGEYDVDTWRRVIDVNLNSVFYCLRYQIPAIERAGGGAIVNMGSILSSVGTAGNPDYVAAKHGVIGLTKTAALDYATRGVRVNAVGPGYIETPLLAHMDKATHDHLISLHPMGRLGRSEEVAALTCFLLSDRASFITGSYQLVDGGYTVP